MPYDPLRHHRRSIRLKGYDYSLPGVYFVTICAQRRGNIFGTIPDGTMHLNDVGRMIEYWWAELPHKYPWLTLDTSITMPDHLHGILFFGEHTDTRQTTLGNVIGWLKTMTTNAYLRGIRAYGWEPYDRHFWQRDYFDRIIRNEAHLNATRRYIAENPARAFARNTK